MLIILVENKKAFFTVMEMLVKTCTNFDMNGLEYFPNQLDCEFCLKRSTAQGNVSVMAAPRAILT